MTDIRIEQLSKWTAQQLGLASAPLSVVSGDASFRRYFRANDSKQNRSLIAVDSPPDKEPIASFVQVTDLLSSAGVLVPEIIAASHEQGFMLLQDFGDQLLLPVLTDFETADILYKQAIDTLIQLQSSINSHSVGLPPYDSELLHREMELFREWFIGQHLGLELSEKEHLMLDKWFDEVARNVLSHPQVAVHRDYHSRNLMMVAGENRPGVIDYQDAVVGSYVYDLVSLLKDCYIRWPREQQLQWVDYFHAQSSQHSLSYPALAAVVQDFDWMGIQRHIKVAGIFCRLNYRDGKSSYLNDIPLTLGYLVEALKDYDEFSPVVKWFEQRLAPVLKEKNCMWLDFNDQDTGKQP
ncbi:MAG: phosphotransferase [Gammaproteobacteria bacterium]|nr:phosphotransferase [Gammaproteobacteria bacterium]